jgi:hypothetical protein
MPVRTTSWLRQVIRRGSFRSAPTVDPIPHLPTVRPVRHPELVSAVVEKSGDDLEPFWLAYIACGGTATRTQFSAYLAGTSELEEVEELKVEHTAWELHTFG